MPPNLETAPVGIFLSTSDGRVLGANPALAELLGMSQSSLEGRSLGDIVHPLDLARTTALYEHLFVVGANSIKTLERYLKSSGDVVWANALISLDEGADDAAPHFVTQVDLTPPPPDKVRRDVQTLREAFEQAPVGMAMTSVEPGSLGRFLHANEAFCGITGYNSSELEGMTLFDVVASDGDEENAMWLRQLAAGGSIAVQLEQECLHASGAKVWVMLSTSLVLGPDREPLHLVSQIEDITSGKSLGGQLAHHALHDPLTGLANRLLLMDRLRHALTRLRRQPGAIAVLFLDLDDFKTVNDGFGHEAGDDVLISVAHRLAQTVRPSDTVGRIGGDEFVVVCEDLQDESEIIDIAARIKKAVAEPHAIRAGEAIVTASIGIATTSGADEPPETLLRNADTAMYRAKGHGKDRHEVFSDMMRVWANERVDIERALREVVRDGRLRVAYQPIVSLRSGEVTSVEALVRYEDHDGRLVEPAEFLEAAEGSGLIVPIGNWVLEEACRQAGRWRAAAPDRVIGVSVNLSARQVARPNLLQVVADAVAQPGFEPGMLSLEITETVLMDAAMSSASSFGDLQQLGVHLGIDDFGMGYSSLSYLKRFPVDFIKVDRSFVSGLGVDAEDSAIVTAIVGLGRALGLATIAEGVETLDQLQRLRTIQCDYLQGFYFSKPQVEIDITELIERTSHLPELVVGLPRR